MTCKWLNEIKWDEQGLVPVIAQDAASGDVLMFAWMNREALEKTAAIGQAVYWSRSRRKLWHKGEESGHFQKVVEIRTDCDNDVVLLKIEQVGGIACHTGRKSCFFQRLDGRLLGAGRAGAEGSQGDLQMIDLEVIHRVQETLMERKGAAPESSYVASLYAKGTDAICKKVAEEAAETIMAAKDGDRLHLVREVCDLWFHSLVLLTPVRHRRG